MKPECEKRLQQIREKFIECHKALLAIGDETRQLILLSLLESDLTGVRVGEIAKKTHLTRPSVSHHLQILKDAEIVNMRRDGTRNYYYLDGNISSWHSLTELVNLIDAGIHEISLDVEDK